MLKWLASDNTPQVDARVFNSIAEGLQRSYKDRLWPVEKDHDFGSFHSPELTDADFSAKPMVLLLGQYSTGKSTFIRHILGRDYPGLRIGPEPTTDKFVVVTHGKVDQVIPGNALVVDQDMPFVNLGHLGNNFLCRFECSKLDCPVLEGVTLVDTPGILSGEKQRLNRGYDFDTVVRWFADHVDMILLLFDVSKLDISDEFRRTIQAIRGNDAKVHILLNKADQVTTPQLMRVYGSLMWSLGKVIDTPEVSRVYIGSFWDEPLANDDQRKLFESEENDLYTVLAQLPRGAAVRKVNDLIKRARLAKVHAYIMRALKRKMPNMFGKALAQKRLIHNLASIYQEVAEERSLPLGDFPDIRHLAEVLAGKDFTKFKGVDPKKMEALDQMLSSDIPQLLKMLPGEHTAVEAAKIGLVGPEASPFAVMKVDGATETSVYQNQWLTAPDPQKYRKEFEALGPDPRGKLSGQGAKRKLIESKLPSNVLHRIWNLSDVNRDGCLDLYEYALAMHFVKMKLDGQDLPVNLPPNMVPRAESAESVYPPSQPFREIPYARFGKECEEPI